jgi:predicted  nucleic acid-binding Zn-ribbon protein
MTAEESKLLTGLETKVRYLIFVYTDLQKEKDKLEEELIKVKTELSDVQSKAQEWEKKYQNLMFAKTITVSEQDAKKTQNRLSKLEREIDKCIALLNE